MIPDNHPPYDAGSRAGIANAAEVDQEIAAKVEEHERNRPHLPRLLWFFIIATLIAGGVQIGLQWANNSNVNTSDQYARAKDNRDTCAAVANAQWRDAISRAIKATNDHDQTAFDAAADRLDELSHDSVLLAAGTLCPFHPGDPDATPRVPHRPPHR